MVATKYLLGAILTSTSVLGVYIPHAPRAEPSKFKTSSASYSSINGPHIVTITSAGRVVTTLVYNKNMTMHGTGTRGTHIPTTTAFSTMKSMHNKTMSMTRPDDMWDEDDTEMTSSYKFDDTEMTSSYKFDDMDMTSTMMDDMTTYPTMSVGHNMTKTSIVDDEGMETPSPTMDDEEDMPSPTDEEDMPSPTHDEEDMPSPTHDEEMPSPTMDDEEEMPSSTMTTEMSLTMAMATKMPTMTTHATPATTMTSMPTVSSTTTTAAAMPTSPAGKSDSIFTDKIRYAYYSKIPKDQLVYISNHIFEQVDKWGKIKLVADAELRNSMVAGKAWYEKQKEKNGKESVCTAPAYTGGDSKDPLIYCNKESRYGVRINNLMDTAWTETCWEHINNAVWLAQAITSGNIGIPEGEVPEYYMTANTPTPTRFFQHKDIEISKETPWNVTGQVFRGGNPLRMAYITLENPGCPDIWKNIEM
ncbi:uncharacterized protein DFL_003840 [Arthrobotrys flagrans]|uniref:SCP domain-containing protein n=1 Tax=Arthrobotrys flagrans TaxID=97331 RepID=A0A437A301_ARTFL|nr:hypothetical protein DFL_003840 [Arthrobotrys flagrans]